MLNSIFERIIKDKNGVQVRVRFTVVDGMGQIVSMEPIVKSEILALPFEKTDRILVTNTVLPFLNIISPYFSLDFLMSQPTRAPALAY
ncbi:MAG TPA: hypothetical protein VJI66_00655 [Candidatus Paceibacterota bacterium]